MGNDRNSMKPECWGAAIDAQSVKGSRARAKFSQ